MGGEDGGAAAGIRNVFLSRLYITYDLMEALLKRKECHHLALWSACAQSSQWLHDSRQTCWVEAVSYIQ